MKKRKERYGRKFENYLEWNKEMKLAFVGLMRFHPTETEVRTDSRLVFGKA
jgi:hypothetical protein